VVLVAGIVAERGRGVVVCVFVCEDTISGTNDEVTKNKRTATRRGAKTTSKPVDDGD
jgi:hypothetical protein